MEVKVSCENCSQWIEGDSEDRFLQCGCGRQYMVSVLAVNAPETADD